MTATNETVHDRIAAAQTELTPTQLAAGALFVAAVAFALLFLQDPVAHDSMHNFRHAIGVTCH